MKRALLLLAALTLTGCAISATPYAIAPDNVIALRKHTTTPIRLGTFTSDKPGKSGIMCRGEGIVQTPGKVPFEKFIEDAFRAELVVAGIETPDAPVTLTGHLERMHFETFARSLWELQVTLTSSNGRRLTVAENYEFPWRYIATHACNGAAAAMVPAAQALVRAAITHPNFASLLVPTPTAAEASKPETPAAEAQPPAESAVVARVAPAVVTPPVVTLDRRWVVGRWVSEGGSNTLKIRSDLSFVWISTFRGEYLRGTGRGEIEGDTLMLDGHFWTGHLRPDRRPVKLFLKRDGEKLSGELHTSRVWPGSFVRDLQ